MLKRLISPSLLSADFVNLERDIKMLETSGADWLHIDVMDGQFVPNLTIGPPVLKAIKRVAHIPCDVHLMIEKPDQMVEAFCQAGADILTVHVEAVTHLHRVIQHVKSFGVKAGVALNPHTPLSSIEEVLGDLDLVLIMSVNPGFGGQSFIPNTLSKLKRLRMMLNARDLHHVRIEVDGGVKLENIAEIAEAGADVLVSGSGILKSSDPVEMIRLMHEKLKNIHIKTI